MTTPAPDFAISSVAIVGVGLIGASFGLALRESGFSGPILGVSSPAALDAAAQAGAISGAGSLAEAVQKADLIYLAQPVARILKTIEEMGPAVQERISRRPILVTDAGSTKQAIVDQAARCLPANVFLGGHPMAGKEISGAEAAEASLFRGRPYVLTPPPGFENAFFASFLALVANSGAAPVLQLTPAEHDSVVAMTSHLPQLLSTTLGLTLAAHANPLFSQVHGAGLMDMTRLALSSPDLWQSIVDTNRPQILDVLDKFGEQLAEMRTAVACGNISTGFQKANTICIQIRAKH